MIENFCFAFLNHLALHANACYNNNCCITKCPFQNLCVNQACKVKGKCKFMYLCTLQKNHIFNEYLCLIKISLKYIEATLHKILRRLDNISFSISCFPHLYLI